MKKLDNSREKFMHVNVDNASFQMEFDDEYVDKSDLISLTNKFINKSRRFMCVTRPRRFGKSVTVKMLNAYCTCPRKMSTGRSTPCTTAASPPCSPCATATSPPRS